MNPPASIPKIFYVNPFPLDRADDWRRCAGQARAMGFETLACAPIFTPHVSGDVFATADHDSVNPALGERNAEAALATLAELCDREGLGLMLDLVVSRVAVDGRLAHEQPGWFRSRSGAGIDPRVRPQDAHTAIARFEDPGVAEQFGGWWQDRVRRWTDAGVKGFRCLQPHEVPVPVWRRIMEAVPAENRPVFFAWTPGVDWPHLPALEGAGFGGVFSSLPWWDRRVSWFTEEHELLRRIAPVLGCPEAPFGERLATRLAPGEDIRIAYRQALRLAAATGSGLLVPAGFEIAATEPMNPTRVGEDFSGERDEASLDLADEIRDATALAGSIAADTRGEMRTLTSPGSRVTVLLRAQAGDLRHAEGAIGLLINPDFHRAHAPEQTLAPFVPETCDSDESRDGMIAPLAPGEVRVIEARRPAAVTLRGRRKDQLLQVALKAPRIVLDKITPSIDNGRFAVKRILGETVTVTADIFADGHDVISAELLWSPADENDWQRVPMRHIVNDRWEAMFTPARVGRHLFTVEAWWDEYETLAHDLTLKQEAGVDVAVELEEGRLHLQRSAVIAKDAEQHVLLETLVSLVEAPPAEQVAILLARQTRAAVAASDERHFLVRHEPAIPIDFDPKDAAFSSWYEMFPRSATDDPTRHGTFGDVIRHLPRIRDMGFDVLYFPPIHPIGATNRKGPNNSLRPEPDDHGSPYAIGSAEGGHDAIHPALGRLKDFQRLREAAAEHGLEIALDFAIQCSPDHPWLKEHPGWFRHRPDGTIKHAENPPKKYEDIVNVDFYAEDALPELWVALRDVVMFWVAEGIRIFRVDNPHTKPLPFWEWLIASVRSRHPDVLFLAEAFTRPKMMYRLGKIGFSQSYTYFTWRNTKQELSDYLTELTTTEARDFYRPHFFVNTPDINPIFLQSSGRGGFLIRAALAATLSGLWGMYSGFELCEAAPLPGREEYLDSEKYQIRVRDYAAPGNIVSEITALNRIRKANPALQSHLGVKFYNAFNDQIMLYGKLSPGAHDMILVAVSFDPHNPQEADFEAPLWEFGLPDHGSLAVEDLMRGGRTTWTGKHQRIRLDPAQLPFAIWRIAPIGGA